MRWYVALGVPLALSLVANAGQWWLLDRRAAAITELTLQVRAAKAARQADDSAYQAWRQQAEESDVYARSQREALDRFAREGADLPDTDWLHGFRLRLRWQDDAADGAADAPGNAAH